MGNDILIFIAIFAILRRIMFDTISLVLILEWQNYEELNVFQTLIYHEYRKVNPYYQWNWELRLPSMAVNF